MSELRDSHPRGEIERLLRGDATPEERRRAVRHLLTGCAVCRTSLRPQRGDDEALDQAISRAAATAADLAARVAGERRQAGELVDRLPTLSPEQQRLLVANSSRAGRRAVCELVLEKARAARHRDAAETLHLAELARLAADRLSEADGRDLQARAWAELGNARRICSDLAGAELALTRARELADGCPDPLLAAELLSLEASLAGHQRRFPAAIRSLHRARKIYRRLGDDIAVARTLVHLGHVQATGGDPHAGIRSVRSALIALDGSGDDRLRLMALHNLIGLYLEAGSAQQAAALIPQARRAYEQLGEHLDLLRLEWLAARVAVELGRLGEAARRLVTLRQRYSRAGMPFEAALVSLDLAAIYARQRRRGPLRVLAFELLEVFRGLCIPRETLATAALLARAEADEAVELTARLTAMVDSARRARPSARSPIP